MSGTLDSGPPPRQPRTVVRRGDVSREPKQEQSRPTKVPWTEAVLSLLREWQERAAVSQDAHYVIATRLSRSIPSPCPSGATRRPTSTSSVGEWEKSPRSRPRSATRIGRGHRAGSQRARHSGPRRARSSRPGRRYRQRARRQVVARHRREPASIGSLRQAPRLSRPWERSDQSASALSFLQGASLRVVRPAERLVGCSEAPPFFQWADY